VLEGDRVRLRVGHAGATLNEVEIHGMTTLHPGDLLSEGEFIYVVLPRPPATPSRRSMLLQHWTWQQRLEEEVMADSGTFTILLGRSGAFAPEFAQRALSEFPAGNELRVVLGSFGRNLLEVLVIGEAGAAESIRQFMTDRAAARDETVRWGTATFPSHATTAEELWSVALNRLLGLEAPRPSELVWSDPCMTRLRSLADRWASGTALAFVGAEGVGRESFARLVRASRTPAAPFVVHRAARFERASWNEDVSRAGGGSLHVRRPGMLPDEVRRAFWASSSFQPSAGFLPSGADGSLPANQIVIPDLIDRPADIFPIAEFVLHLIDAQLGRRRSSLRAETRAIVQGVSAPENVRTLRNVVACGALNAGGAEVRPEHLQIASTTPLASGVRARIREAERREIEAALHGSGWNVAEAARRMELPRRTLVYRMARLGLRRPRGSA
jgi:hypothetical protein